MALQSDAHTLASERGPNSTALAPVRSLRWVPLSGVLFAVLLATSLLTGFNAPDSSSSAAKVQSWYLAHKGTMGLETILTIVAVIVGLFFLNYVRSCFRRAEGEGWFTPLFWAGVVVFAVGGAIGAGISATFADDPKVLSQGSIQLLNAINQNLNYPITCIGMAVMFLGAGLVIYKTRLLPRWLAWVAWVFVLASASFFLGFIALLGAGIWLIVVAVMLAVHRSAPEG